MYSPVVTTRRNEAMKARKQLRSDYKQIQTFDKNPAILLVKKTRGDNIFSALRTLCETGPNHRETSPLICTANQWTVLYMIGA